MKVITASLLLELGKRWIYFVKQSFKICFVLIRVFLYFMQQLTNQKIVIKYPDIHESNRLNKFLPFLQAGGKFFKRFGHSKKGIYPVFPVIGTHNGSPAHTIEIIEKIHD